MNLSQFKKYLPFSIAIVIALLAVSIYIYSGQGSLDQNTRKLQQNPQVENIQLKQNDLGQKNAQIDCKDGSSYDVYIPPGSTSYDALAASKCATSPN